MRVSVLGPKGPIWQGAAKNLILPTEDGDVCVLDFHQSFLVRLAKGDIRLGAMGAGGAQKASIPVKDGFARMHGNELVILTEA